MVSATPTIEILSSDMGRKQRGYCKIAVATLSFLNDYFVSVAMISSTCLSPTMLNLAKQISKNPSPSSTT